MLVFPSILLRVVSHPSELFSGWLTKGTLSLWDYTLSSANVSYSATLLDLCLPSCSLRQYIFCNVRIYFLWVCHGRYIPPKQVKCQTIDSAQTGLFTVQFRRTCRDISDRLWKKEFTSKLGSGFARLLNYFWRSVKDGKEEYHPQVIALFNNYVTLSTSPQVRIKVDRTETTITEDVTLSNISSSPLKEDVWYDFGYWYG